VNFARYVSERKAYLEDPAVVVLMKLRHRDLHAGAKAQAKSLREWKSTEDKPGRQKYLLFSTQVTARPKHGVLLKHRPDPPLDPVVDRSIENDGATEQIGAAGGKVSADGSLNIPGPHALGGCESGGKDRVTDAVGWRSRRQRTSKEESYEVVPAAFRRGKCPILQLERQIAKSIWCGGLVRQIVGREDADF